MALSARAYNLLCTHQTFVKRLDAAIASCCQALEVDETFLIAALAMSDAYRAKGMYKEWAEEWQRNVLVRGDREQAQLVANVFAREGTAGLERFAACTMALCKADSSMPGEICAAFYSEEGDLDAAFLHLERAFEHRSPFLPAVDLNHRAAALHADRVIPRSASGSIFQITRVARATGDNHRSRDHESDEFLCAALAGGGMG